MELPTGISTSNDPVVSPRELARREARATAASPISASTTPATHGRRPRAVGLSELFSTSDERLRHTVGQVAVLVGVSTLTEKIVYPDHTPAAAADVGVAERADELGRMLTAYGSATRLE